MSLLGVSLLLSAGLALASNDCVPANDVVNQLHFRDYPPQPRNGAKPTVEVEFLPETVRQVEKQNRLHIDGSLSLRWKDESLLFAHLHPCDTLVSVTEKASSLWSPPLSFSNGEHIIYHKHSKAAELADDGTITVRQRVEQEIECTPSNTDSIFGSLTCPLRIRAERSPPAHYKWVVLHANHNQSMLVHRRDFNEETSEMELTLDYQPNTEKPLLKFFLPSIFFMGISWLSLALGPMAITRSVLIIGSLILLMLHYSSFPTSSTHSITGFDVWRLFSFIFVMATLAELVLVTCMASVGRSRSLCRCLRKNKKKGAYDVEPQYEELNDLRQRKTRSGERPAVRTRKTCGCCRYSALFMDFVSMVALLLFFLLFCFCYFRKGSQLTQAVNDFRVHDYLPALP